jgi:hypothetical protein
MAAGAAPYAFMPAVTGAFYASHLDNVELDRRSGWLLEIGPQAILTSFMGITASNVWISLGDTTWPTGIDFVILVAIMGFAVGASLAWYIPKNAVRRNYDPLREVKENRVREITALAVERFSNPDKAEHWLQTETSSLQGASPMTALSEARNYEEVLRLINRIPAAQLNGTGPQGKTLAKAKRRPSRRAQPTKGFSEPVLGLAEGKTRGLNPSGRSPRRNRQPADIRFDLQSGLPGRQHQLGARPVAQHDELGTGADRGARSGRPIDAGDVSETADIPPRAAEVRLGGAEHEAGAQAPDRERIAPSVEEQRIAAADGHRQ